MWDLSKIIITPEMLSLIGEIDEFKGAWQLLGRMAPDKLNYLRRVASIESVGSSTRIEGSKLSDKEVEKLLYRNNLKNREFGKEGPKNFHSERATIAERQGASENVNSLGNPTMPKTDSSSFFGITNIEEKSFISRDEQEVAGYAYVCEEIFQGFESIGFSENIIKQLHAWLLKFSEKDQRHRGHYKTISNNVEAFDASGKSVGIIFETTSPFETPLRMQELIEWTRDQLDQKKLHPLLIIGIFVVIFLAIHPFQDGNGRLSRVLTTLLLLKSGYLYVPYSSLESMIERSKESYYLALRRTQTSLKSETPDFAPWLVFFLRSLQKQKIHLQHKVEKEKILMMHFSELSNQIIHLLYDHGSLGLNDFEKLTGANRNTLKKHLADLTNQGTILRFGKGRATKYLMP